MNEKTLEQLDYFRVRDEMAGYCASEESRELLQQRLPFASAADMNAWKQETAEWMQYAASRPTVLSGWPVIAPLFPLLSVSGAVLDTADAYALGQFCLAVRKVKESFAAEHIKTDGLRLPCLEPLVSEIPDMSAPEHLIFRIIDEAGQLRDLAELRAIRASILHIRKDIETLMRNYTSDSALREVLQSGVPALRNDRQVLAVKAGSRGRIKGIVHEVSQTGRTLYIEPDDIVQRSNDLLQEESRLALEIRRILKELTAGLSSFREAFENAHALMSRLDCSAAAARWGIAHRCVCAGDCVPSGAESGSSGSEKIYPVTLIGARHPLLGSRAVPVDVQFLEGCRVLIITGPNTGGKTVTLKTIALLSLLNQAGFPVPAGEGTRLPVFSSVFADIGDEQSLDQSLSTFSGHMKNISDAVANADSGSLVLLDELGSGTDPQEGGAIAMAVLDCLIEKNAVVLVTTHHGILKNYGYTHQSCVNASVDFDETTLSPTYRIRMGIPGESHALDIARRSGLSADVIQKAQSYIAGNQADVSALIKGLNEKHAALAKLEAECRQKEQIVSEKWRKVDLKELRLRQHELELRENGWRRSREFLNENRRMLENLVRELREGEITREKTLKVKDTVAAMTAAVTTEKNALDAEQQSLEAFAASVAETNRTKEAADDARTPQKRLAGGRVAEPENAASVPEIGTGVEVYAGKSRLKGIVLGPAKKGAWFVRVGSMKMTFQEQELAAVPAQKAAVPSVSVEIAEDSDGSDLFAAASGGRVSFSNGGSSGEKPVFELRLLGMRYEAAVKALEHQLDLCAMHNFKNFSVIHGKGTGALQQAVHDCLRGYPGVAEFHFAQPEDGGTGKTYVTLL